MKWLKTVLLFTISNLFNFSYGKGKNQLDIIFGGDVTHRTVMDYNVQQGRCTYNRTFQNVKDIFQKADETIINLEGTVGRKDELKPLIVRDGTIYFLTNPDFLQAFQYAGIRYVTVANNHLLDYGNKGIQSTLNELKKRKIKYSGVEFGEMNKRKPQEPLIISKKGIRVGILSYCDKPYDCILPRNHTNVGPAIFYMSNVMEDLKRLKKRKDKLNGVVVFLHHQEEFQIIPNSMDESKELIRNLTQYADVIVSSHAHVATKHLYYRNKLRTGQLGNLLFPMTEMNDLRGPLDEKKTDANEAKKYEKFWYQLTKLRKDETTRGKLVKLSFNKNGFMKDESKYMFTINDVDENHCLYVNPIGKWKKMCLKNDPYCEGTTDCNYLECNIDVD